MPRSLVVVESPAKARTIAGFLGRDFVVKSSMGHVRDLESKGLAVDVDNHFKPTYVVYPDKKHIIKELRDALKGADELYLATDEDREGEAISWHLLEVLKPKVPVRRMVFHEITQSAIDEAIRRPRAMNFGLVDAQETRRIVDRLFGYPVSELLWRKVGPGLSAGRVQSVAVRLVVERERERMAFVPAGYWDIDAMFSTTPGFTGTLVALDGTRVASGRDFDRSGQLRDAAAAVVVLDEPTARGLAQRLDGAEFRVRRVEEKPYASKPKPPFMTSTLQQEGGRKLGMTAQQVMRTAQNLYERGYITYMRTDSVALAESAVATARALVRQLYGAAYLPERPRVYSNKVKNAQEAHEAIRPAGESWRTPRELGSELRRDELRLYELIWMRTVASQMADARGRTVSVRIEATSSAGEQAELGASGRTIEFPGYLRAYVEGRDDPEAELDDRETLLPALAENDILPVSALEPKGHTTSPPARYTEASLIRRMEELSVGRPSTYASIIGTIQDRDYVRKRSNALVPTWTAFAVTNLLEHNFSHLVDYAFTAHMEDDLDEIAKGNEAREPWLRAFWFGNGRPGLARLVDQGRAEIDPAAVNSIPIGRDDAGVDVVVRNGRYGPYLQYGDQRASIPDDLPPDELTVARALELLSAPAGDEPLGVDPASGLPLYVKSGRFGPYVQLGDAETLPEGEKPRMASLFTSMTPDLVTVDEALRLLSLPRVVGIDPATGEEITALHGRYGPYLKRGSETRSLDREEQIFTVGLNEAVERFAAPKYGPGSRRSTPTTLRELGDDPTTSKPIVVRAGRYGPYVTDGETNASLRKGDEVDSLTMARALELLAERRAKGPARPRRATNKAGAKKTAAKKTAAKKTAAKKTAAKKTAAKQTAAKQTAARRTAAEKAR
ncbi:MAG: type I DNA topoisomerase [Acidimicrobiales bacterium]